MLQKEIKHNKPKDSRLFEIKLPHSADQTPMEKIKVIEQLDEQERTSIYNIIDGLFAKKKLKDNLSTVLQGV